MTIREFAVSDDKFIKACQRANILNTARQASKYLNEKGLLRKIAMGKALPLEPKHPGYFKWPITE